MHGEPARPRTAAPREQAVAFSRQLNASDSLLWHIESDPCLRTTVVAIALLDGTPEWSALRARMATATREIPRLRQRVVEVPWWLGAPRWVDDERFDLDYHLRRVAAPPPGDLSAVLDLAAPIAMAAFDKQRPLWEFTLVEGLEGGQSALILKVHHSFTDGVGGVAIAALLTDAAPGRTPAGRRRRSPAPLAEAPRDGTRPGGSGSAVSDALTDSMAGVGRTVAGSMRGARLLPALAARAALHPLEAASSAARVGRSVGKLLAPVRHPMSPVMVDRGMSRHLAAFDIPLDDLRAAAHAAGSTLNDAFLAAVAGGMRRYHEHHHTAPPELRVTMPINLRRPGDAAGSNRFTPARFALPIGTGDPVARMRELGALAKSWRGERAVALTGVLAEGLNRLPPSATTSLFGSMLKGIDFVATNVPGLADRAYLTGVEVIRLYAFAPPSGSAFSVALMSHVDRCCVGINVDTAAVHDADTLVRCLREGFDEVVAVGATVGATAGRGAA